MIAGKPLAVLFVLAAAGWSGSCRAGESGLWPEDGTPSLLRIRALAEGSLEGIVPEEPWTAERERLRAELEAIGERLAQAAAGLRAGRLAADAMARAAVARRDKMADAVLAGLKRARGGSGAWDSGPGYASRVVWLSDLQPRTDGRSRRRAPGLRELQEEMESLSAESVFIRSRLTLADARAEVARRELRNEAVPLRTSEAQPHPQGAVIRDPLGAETGIRAVSIHSTPPQESATSPLEGQVPIASGRFRLPLQGTIVAKFGDRRAGQRLRGVILTADRAQPVLAPGDGLVAYAGPFRDIGSLLIIEHRDAYHSLVIGASRLEVQVGDVVTEGQVVGWLDRGASESMDLYLELRRVGEPIDPISVLSTHVGEVRG